MRAGYLLKMNFTCGLPIGGSENVSILLLQQEQTESRMAELIALTGYGVFGMCIILSRIAVGNIVTGIGYLHASVYRLFVYVERVGDITPLQCMTRNWQLTLFVFGDTLSLFSFLMVSLQHYMAIASITMNKHVDRFVQFAMLPLIIVMIMSCWLSAALRQEEVISAYCYGPSVISNIMTKIIWGAHAVMGLLNFLIYLKMLFKLRIRRKVSRTATCVNAAQRDVAVIKRLSYYMTALFLTSFVPDVLICTSLKELPFKFLFLLPGVARTISSAATIQKVTAQCREHILNELRRTVAPSSIRRVRPPLRGKAKPFYNKCLSDKVTLQSLKKQMCRRAAPVVGSHFQKRQSSTTTSRLKN
ncbi:hypothetical protein M513_01420 [Trichuris suis]|uniref:G-protein coupled receptors family 1 profile domain-containing protein n=1 Tax=Trichuris suis TaxID=68888 RepID=A0A085MKK4_9BILA|nr:hypothetical protein M513_01420 [Trichuris suis]